MAKPTDDQDPTYNHNQDKIVYQQQVSQDHATEALSQEFDLNYMTTLPRLSSEKNNDNKFDLEAFVAAFDGENQANMTVKTLISGGDIHNDREVLNDIDEFDNLGDIPVFEFIEDGSHEFMGMLSESLDSSENVLNIDESFAHERIYNDQELLTISADQEVIPVYITPSEVTKIETNVGLEKSLFGCFENASLEKKQWWIAGTVGVVSVMAVVIVSVLANFTTPVKQRESIRNTNWLMPLLIPLTAGATGAVTAWFMTNFMVKKISRSTKDLQSQFNAMGQGNLNVAATVYSKDELGQLATDFNNMVQSVVAKTQDNARLAIEQKETKENLQSQVIRLLDEVEGAGKGDLTVRAEVTAEGLGAVADAFNLIIQNLQNIVQQVKVSAQDVTKAASTSETLREIEQIVMQIQSETSSVMMAMEEGTQQVIHQTRLAEESKRSLDNIIQVANHIDMLVRSITNDTGEQRETSRDVAQVMQFVERTAQETSQEAQRSAQALQYLVGVSRNLIISVERFRVESNPESGET